MMILPDCCLSMKGATALAHRYAPLRLMSIVRSQSSSLVSSTDFVIMTPALLTRMSTRPKWSTVARTRSFTSADFETSARTESASPPSRLIASTPRLALAANPVDGALRALGGEPFRDRLADPTRGTGHNRYLAVQSLLGHLNSLLLRSASGRDRPAVDYLATAAYPD